MEGFKGWFDPDAPLELIEPETEKKKEPPGAQPNVGRQPCASASDLGLASRVAREAHRLHALVISMMLLPRYAVHRSIVRVEWGEWAWRCYS
jgi:hypothetical protein